MLAGLDFVRLRDSIARALAAVPRLEREDVEALCRSHRYPDPRTPGAAPMQHVALKAHVAETTEVGHFAALAAAYSLDRTGERIIPGAFGATIARWQESGKQVPLHWNHGSNAEDVIGEVDPQTMIEVEDGLFVEGDLDIHDSDRAREVWRSVKRNRISLSFS